MLGNAFYLRLSSVIVRFSTYFIIYPALSPPLRIHTIYQLPTPVWMSKQDEIIAWYEERDLPVSIGGTGFGTVPTHARIAKW